MTNRHGVADELAELRAHAKAVQEGQQQNAVVQKRKAPTSPETDAGTQHLESSAPSTADEPHAVHADKRSRLDPAAPTFILPTVSVVGPAPDALVPVAGTSSQPDAATQGTSGAAAVHSEVPLVMAEAVVDETEATAEPEVATMPGLLESNEATPIAAEEVMEEADGGGETEEENEMTEVVETPGVHLDRMSAHT